MAGIANALVTATPLTPGLPTLSGYTNSSGQVTFALTPTISYTLTFSGPAIGKVTPFKPANSTFTLYTVKNKGALSLSISGQKLQGGKSVYAFHGSIPVKALKTFAAWQPGTRFKNSKAKSTSLVMPQSDVSVSYLSAIKKLYAVDGYNASGFSVAINHAYDASTNTWSTKASDTTARVSLAAGVVGSKLYVVGGYDGSTLAINHAYDPSTNTWSTKTPDTTARSHLATGVIGSKLYAVDGNSALKIIAVNHAYDPSTNTWSTKASDTTGRNYLTAGVVGSKLYAVDGDTATKITAINHAYDPSTNTWSTKASDTTARSVLVAGVMGSKLYAVDGYFSSPVTINHAYDPSTNTWSTKASDTTARYALVAGVIGPELYAVDGGTAPHGGGRIANNHAYDPSTNTWSTRASNTTARDFLAAGVL